MQLFSSSLLNIVLLSVFASLGTGLGGLIAIIRRPGKRSYGLLMGFTAGVMICLSFLELVKHAWDMAGAWTATIGFGLGATFMLLLDHFAPHIRFGEKEVRGTSEADIEEGQASRHRQRRRFGQVNPNSQPVDLKLVNTGLLLAVGITLHNLPEGIAVGAGYLHNPKFGLFVAIAILLHNIPEGIATALPLCRSGLHRWDAFKVAFLSGFAEPVGALIASLVLISFENFVPVSLAFAGGVMVFITLDELIPTAREFGHEHYSAIGIIIGSLCVFVLSGAFGI
jgi:zinc transporter, ZIP family